MSLSVIITAKNAAHTIIRTLNSVNFADERLVIVDDSSSDNTADLAAKAKAKVITRRWPGYGPQKNFGLKQAKSDWVIFVDADEEITPALRHQLIKVINRQQNKNYYWLRITTVFLNRPLNHLFGHNLRLFKRPTAHWTNAPVHEQVSRSSGSIIKLRDPDADIITQPLLHHSHQTIKSYLKKMHRYTSLDAQQMHKTNQHRSGRPVKPFFSLPYYLAFRQFIKLYFYRRGLLDGYAGLIWCLLSTYYEYEMSRKYLVLVKKSK